jgi:polysaccharide export outer membrane protein
MREESRKCVNAFTIVLAVVFAASMGCAYAPIPERVECVPYRLSAGDLIEVKAQPDSGLFQKMRIRPDGCVSYHKLGELRLEGMTVPEAENVMERRIAEVLGCDVKVSVDVMESGGQSIYVLGEVDKPGRYPYTYSMTVLDAVALAGSYRHSRASLRYTQVTRSSAGKAAQIIRTNLNSVIFSGDMSQNMRLLPDDIVYVPPDFFTRIGDAVSNVLNPLRALTESVLGFPAAR